MVQQLKSPRRIMMLVPAGKPVDDVIESLLPLINEGDVIIDGGNSFLKTPYAVPNTWKKSIFTLLEWALAAVKKVPDSVRVLCPAEM